MDPTDPDSFNHRTELLSTGRTYHFVDQLPQGYDHKRHPTLICIHGFPDLWYGWRYQIGPWTHRGCRVVVPDMLGYGGTSKPNEPEEYTTKKLCADLAALLDLLGVYRAVVIGHDWGSYTAGRFALWHPERLLGLIMLSVPYTPPSKQYLPLTEVVKRAPNLGYQLYFEQLRSSEEILSHLGKFVGLVFNTPGSKKALDFTPTGALEKLFQDTSIPDKLPTCLTDEERRYYLQQLGQSMQGPLNYYRTSQLRHEEEQAASLGSQLRNDLPYLFLWGTDDLTVVTSVIAKSNKFIARFQDVAIEGKGHWLMVEAKEEVTTQVINWLERLMAHGTPTRTTRL
ncbi:alpha/beta-hydrolase [Coprinopsis marcescibilis]|uniref:Alpha/beta-hydrolase n=1 Tax=Coprinopsis marcescibilis TaxID=230819 RepID=A0A5C3L050_COPMA|nr:alpha/beta-hydrolase [Coprinopsis marcescibilis]